jgi:predicted GNAT family acetyltransferase
MRAIRIENADEFERRVTPMLLRHEAENNAFLGLMERFKTQADVVLCAVEDSGEIIAVATMTPPWHMLISRCPPVAAERLADFLGDQHIDVPGIQGIAECANVFASRWMRRHRVRADEKLALGVYLLDRVIAPPPVSGSLRQAGESDSDLLLRWGDDFTRELGMPDRGDGPKVTRESIAAGKRFLWCDPHPVCCCGVAGPTPNGIRINFVYTPPANRRRGYASAATAAVSQRMLDCGKKFCFLFTDLANPTSNKIYQAVGYRHVCNQIQLMFESTSPAAGSSA